MPWIYATEDTLRDLVTGRVNQDVIEQATAQLEDVITMLERNAAKPVAKKRKKRDA